MAYVDLRPWRAARAARDPAQGINGSARIYFRPVEFMPDQDYPHLEPWLKAQAELRARFAANAALADSLHSNESQWRRIKNGHCEEIYTMLPGIGWHISGLTYPIRTELMCVPLGNIYSDLFDPVLEQYEMLEKKVESHQAYSQPDFRW